MRLPVRLKNANHMKWSATAKELSKQCRPCRQASDNPKEGTEISSNKFKTLSWTAHKMDQSALETS
eukprot:3685899-Amphidinium_carterae.1